MTVDTYGFDVTVTASIGWVSADSGLAEETHLPFAYARRIMMFDLERSKLVLGQRCFYSYSGYLHGTGVN